MNDTTQTSAVSNVSLDALFAAMSAAEIGAYGGFDEDPPPAPQSAPVAVVKTETVVEQKPLPAPAPKKEEPRMFSPDGLLRLIRNQTTKRAAKLTEPGKARLAACAFAYRCVGEGKDLYKTKELDALRRELISQVEFAFQEMGEVEPRNAAHEWMDTMRAEPASKPEPTQTERWVPPPFTQEKIRELFARVVVQNTDPRIMAKWIVSTMLNDRSRYSEEDFGARVADVTDELTDQLSANAPIMGALVMADREALDIVISVLERDKPKPAPVAAAPRPALVIRKFFEEPSVKPIKVDVPTDNPGPAPTAEALAAKKAAAHKARMEKQDKAKSDLTAGAMKIIAKPAKSDKAEKKNKKNRDK
jgi:hypothetical protein